jgi:predicted transcriptional regulator
MIVSAKEKRPVEYRSRAELLDYIRTQDRIIATLVRIVQRYPADLRQERKNCRFKKSCPNA